jgi:hypothetical protein
MDTNPAPQPQSPLPDQPQPIAPQPPAPAPAPAPLAPQPVMTPPQQPITPMAPAPKKKSMLWLWITIGVVFLVVIGLVIGFFVSKSNADKAADDYTNSAKSYLADVYDATSGAATDPADIEKDIEGIDKPELKEAFLSDVSDKYGEAKKLSGDVDSKVSDLQTKIKSYADFYTFYKKNEAINRSIETISASATTSTEVASALKQVSAKLNEFQKLVEDTTFPDELAGKKDALAKAAKVCATSWRGMVAAFDARDRNGYLSGFNDYKACVPPLTTASRPFNDFYDELSSKIKAAGKDVQDLQDSIDK